MAAWGPAVVVQILNLTGTSNLTRVYRAAVRAAHDESDAYYCRRLKPSLPSTTPPSNRLILRWLRHRLDVRIDMEKDCWHGMRASRTPPKCIGFESVWYPAKTVAYLDLMAAFDAVLRSSRLDYAFVFGTCLGHATAASFRGMMTSMR